ncbi:isoprenyl transferase [Clostridium cochlearium]|jgi:undecaprenyl diphosphate synthase|uniref:Isoprenyl transferase n=1 Tax=Clostridium cochlearium TaxID=1494 RepID=A0A239ZYH5_CLOCO|nr:isoprenyl transferase [Clostridium cochlearium]MBE6064315.1 isoprenyl transferase [Clostridium cochlearium]MBU5268761.1 isoprenyl transferase [Clostridium cochlearium]MCG4572609.1 isoprenyl transferase [Clostridium cochlearium]MCR1970671.1 isoprenyl transferase [Clostridium cochlearium]MDU1442226.1 isoprenyl transferase [Clostridium cochlearium]
MWNVFKNKNEQNDKKNNEIKLDLTNIPKHIAIIMDGNGRWAKERNLPRSFGHKAGVETIRDIVKECNNIGVKYLTLYAFSTENWKRPKEEVNALMELLVNYLRKEVDELHENNVVINTIGDISKLPKVCEDELVKAYNKTKDNKGLVLNLALNYGGRDEIIRAIKLMYKDIEKKQFNIENVNENILENYLYTRDMPDPDLIIRPSGEQRISNFLLWQCAYSEFWYSNIKWPDFKKEHLHKAIKDYQNRNRRFGGV